MELHHVAGPGDSQAGGEDPQPPCHQKVPAFFSEAVVVGVLVEDLPLGGEDVFRPLPLQVDEGPLAAAEGEVLEAGELEKVLLVPAAHERRWQVTPWGRAASSTVTT